MPFYEDEYLFGLKGENELKDLVQATFFTSELKKLAKFHPFDFKSNSTYFEIKTRRTKKDDFPSTLIGYNKFQFCEGFQNFEQAYFIFQFTDGVYYYKYQKNDINMYEQKHIHRKDRVHHRFDERKLYLLIPNEKLIKIEY